MNFTRVKIKGQNQKTRKTWQSEEHYRIIWRREYAGVSLPPRFQASVRIHLTDGREMWDFAGKRSLYKTFKAANDACEHHRRLWSAVVQATGVRRIQELCGGKVPAGYPVWIRKEMNSKVRTILENATNPTQGKECDDQDDPIETSPTTENKSETRPSIRKRGRASSATVEDGSTTSHDQDSFLSPGPNVSLVKARVKGRKRPSSKRTARKSPGTGKKRKSTKRLSKRKKAPSQN